MKKTIGLLFLSSMLSAAPCTTLSTVGFSQDQIALVPSLAYEIGYATDNATLPPTVTQSQGTVTVCFQNPSFDAVTVITISSLTTQYQSDNAARAAASAQFQAWQVELTTTTAALNTARQTGFKNLSAANQAAVVQGILQWHWLRTQLGIDQ